MINETHEIDKRNVRELKQMKKYKNNKNNKEICIIIVHQKYIHENG